MMFDLKNHFNVLLLPALKNEDCDLLKWLIGHLQKNSEVYHYHFDNIA